MKARPPPRRPPPQVKLHQPEPEPEPEPQPEPEPVPDEVCTFLQSKFYQ